MSGGQQHGARRSQVLLVAATFLAVVYIAHFSFVLLGSQSFWSDFVGEQRGKREADSGVSTQVRSEDTQKSDSNGEMKPDDIGVELDAADDVEQLNQLGGGKSFDEGSSEVDHVYEEDVEPKRLFHFTELGTAIEGTLLITLNTSTLSLKPTIIGPLLEGRKWDSEVSSSVRCRWCEVIGDQAQECSSTGVLSLYLLIAQHLPKEDTDPSIGQFLKARPGRCRPGDVSPSEIAFLHQSVQTVRLECSGLSPVRIGKHIVLEVNNPDDDGWATLASVSSELPSSKLTSKATTVYILAPLFGIASEKQDLIELEQFATHYLEGLSFAQINIYELGLTSGQTVLDLVAGSPRLLAHLNEGRLVVMDLRREIQRVYGAVGIGLAAVIKDRGALLAWHDCALWHPKNLVLFVATAQDLLTIAPASGDDGAPPTARVMSTLESSLFTSHGVTKIPISNGEGFGFATSSRYHFCLNPDTDCKPATGIVFKRMRRPRLGDEDPMGHFGMDWPVGFGQKEETA